MRYYSFAVILTCIAGIATAGLHEAGKYNEVIAIYKFEDTLDSGPREIHGVLVGDADIVKTNRGNVLKLTDGGQFQANNNVQLAVIPDFSIVAWIGVKTPVDYFQISMVGYDVDEEAPEYNRKDVGNATIISGDDYVSGVFTEATDERALSKDVSLFAGDVGVTDFKWHHVAFSRFGDIYTLFIDGKVVERRYLNDPVGFISDYTHIVVLFSAGSQGSVFVDDLMFLQIGLSVYEIRGIMSSGLDAFLEAMPVDPAEKVATTWGALKSR